MMYKNLADFRKGMQRRIARIEKAADESPRLIARKGVLIMKHDMPFHQGNLIGSTDFEKLARGSYLISSGYPGPQGFAVARFTNQEFTVTPRIKGGMASRMLKTPVGKPVRYGDVNGVRWTANTYPWFDRTVERLAKEFPHFTISRIRSAMKG